MGIYPIVTQKSDDFIEHAKSGYGLSLWESDT